MRFHKDFPLSNHRRTIPLGRIPSMRTFCFAQCIYAMIGDGRFYLFVPVFPCKQFLRGRGIVGNISQPNREGSSQRESFSKSRFYSAAIVTGDVYATTRVALFVPESPAINAATLFKNMTSTLLSNCFSPTGRTPDSCKGFADSGLFAVSSWSCKRHTM